MRSVLVRSAAPLLRRLGSTPCARRLSGVAVTPSSTRPSLLVGTGLAAGVLLQTYLGTADDFFEATFVTSKDPDDIIEFYQAEDLLKVFTMSVPGAFEFIMSGTRFDEEAKEGWDATVHTTFGGVQLMETCFALSEEEEETDDGETVVGYFNRHERFKNFFPLTKLLLWDQTWNYGYKRRADGTCEVFHRGEKFYGPFPVRLIVHIHQTMVAYLCEKHVNSAAFGADGNAEEAESQLANIPKHLLKQYFASLRGEVEKAKAQQQAKGGMHPAALEQLARYEATIKELKELEAKPTAAAMSTSSTLKRRQTVALGGEEEEARRQTLQLRVSDKATRRTLQAAVTQVIDSGSDGASVLASSLEQLALHPDLAYKKTSQKLARRATIREAS